MSSDAVLALTLRFGVREIRQSPQDVSKAVLWPQLYGPLLVVGTAIAIQLLSRGAFTIPNPPAILLLIVVFSAFIGGARSGMVTATMAWLYFAYFFSVPGHPFHYTSDNLRRVIVWAVTVPVMAIMVGILKHRSERAVEISKENAFLTQQVADRKRAEEAARSARVAELANQAKNEFLSRMSHELRTPLNAVLGFGQLLEMEHLSPAQQESVQQILKGGRHLLSLIDEVLDISRVEAGRLAMSPEPVLASDILQEALDLVRPIAATRNIRLHNDRINACNRHILADRQRLKQVLLNLLSNAVKYNHDGGDVTLSCEEMPDSRLRVSVADTGPGIPPDKIGRLFTPFDRLGAELSNVEGTGLGLSLSKRLTEAMGGSLGVESIPSRGSTFWVDLAIVESPLGRVEKAGEQVSAHPGIEPSQQPRVILYIEDNLSNIKLIQRLLAHRPEITLLPAMQGRLGLQLAREHHPDLILLDVQLPDIPGNEVLRQLAETVETRDIPVVVISADATPGQIQRLLAAGARGYLAKPLEVRKFLAVLDEALAAA